VVHSATKYTQPRSQGFSLEGGWGGAFKGKALGTRLKVHSLTTYNDNSFAVSDTGDSYIKAYKPTAKQCSVVVGNGKGTRWK